jgi:hypothetical protein
MGADWHFRALSFGDNSVQDFSSGLKFVKAHIVEQVESKNMTVYLTAILEEV